MAPNLTHSIIDPLSCTGTHWDKVMTNWSLHSPLFPDILASEFLLDCCQAAVCACTVILVRRRNMIRGLCFQGNPLNENRFSRTGNKTSSLVYSRFPEGFLED